MTDRTRWDALAEELTDEIENKEEPKKSPPDNGNAKTRKLSRKEKKQRKKTAGLSTKSSSDDRDKSNEAKIKTPRTPLNRTTVIATVNGYMIPAYDAKINVSRDVQPSILYEFREASIQPVVVGSLITSYDAWKTTIRKVGTEILLAIVNDEDPYPLAFRVRVIEMLLSSTRDDTVRVEFRGEQVAFRELW